MRYVLTEDDKPYLLEDNLSDYPTTDDVDTELALKAPLASPTFTGTVAGITSTMVGLGNVDNTSDANKPVSTATQTALNAKQATLVSATNIKTINSNSLLGSGDLAIAGVSDGDKGDIVVTGTGATWTIEDGAVTAAKTSITGTPDGSKYLRDDFSWQAVSGGSGLTQPQVMARTLGC